MSIWTRFRDHVSRLGSSFDALLRGGETSEAASGGDARSADGGVVFTAALIALAAKMAAADGRVSVAEIDVINRLFHVPDGEHRNVARFFDLARRSMAGFESYARDVARLYRDRPGVLEDVLDGLFSIAYADGDLHPCELEYLTRAADIFGFSEDEFARIHASHREPDSCDPYRILGVSPDCSDEELKQSYRRLVRENHPDSLIGRGVPAEFVAVATRKLAAINHAYDTVLRLRKAV